MEKFWGKTGGLGIKQGSGDQEPFWGENGGLGSGELTPQHPGEGVPGDGGGTVPHPHDIPALVLEVVGADALGVPLGQQHLLGGDRYPWEPQESQIPPATHPNLI